MFVYAAIGVFGLLLLLIMLIAGDLLEMAGADQGIDHDADVGGPAFFSVPIMAAFVTAFGVGGAVARYYELSHAAASGIGIASGVVLAGLVYQFARVLYSQQASSEIHMTGLLGRTAEVTVGIPLDSVGQVTLTVAGERTTHIARSADGGAIAPGVEVQVQGLRGDSVVVARASERE
jgi:membrane protein implicated in regulation of membrane protease activity